MHICFTTKVQDYKLTRFTQNTNIYFETFRLVGNLGTGSSELTASMYIHKIHVFTPLQCNDVVPSSENDFSEAVLKEDW